ncbi:Gfo/Idh/MocA family oxidoreductase [Kribbella sp. NPDC050820]|uniref:Gfo/Idh/MocA family protein n=1 Tax=Kribbella sp. NPDC050820 TaxID=3155408 RepID=UPI0033FC62DB
MRLLQIGMGGWGRDWAATVVPEVPDVKPVGYVDMLPASLAAVVEAGIARRDLCFADIDEAIRATSPDAVLITANLPGHVPAARAALAAGLPVLVEKPFAPSIAEATALVEYAEERDLTVMVSQNYRFQPAVHAVREIVRDGTLGELVSIAVDFRRTGVRRTAPSGRPVLTDPLLGDMSIHHFDLMRAVTGREPEQVYCRTWHPDGFGYGGPPAGAAVITFRDGPIVSYRGSWVSSGPVTAWGGEWRMEFDHGEVWWTSRPDGSESGVAESARIRADGKERAVALPELTATDRAGSLTEFTTSVREDWAPEATGRDNLGSLAITYAAIESALTGVPIDVAVR